MTSFERDYKDAIEGDGIRVLKARKKEIKELEEKLRCTKNSFRAQCIYQEIERKKKSIKR